MGDTTTAPRPGPNDILACGTWSAYVRHRAHGIDCTRCGTDRPAPDTYPDQRRKETR